MAFNINSPPPGVMVSSTPSTKELGDRSDNKMPAAFRKLRSIDGRSLVTLINGMRFGLVAARNILADKFPSGLDASIDSSQSPGGGTTSPASISADVPTWDADVPSFVNVEVVSPTRTLTVPINNIGQLLLQQNNSSITTQYSKNGGAYTSFTNNTILSITNGDTLTFKAVIHRGTAVLITVMDNSTNQVIGSGTLQNSYEVGG